MTELDPLSVAYAYGDLIWQTALGVFLVAGAWAVHAIPTLAVANRARLWRRLHPPPVLRGTLTDAKTVRTADGELVELDGRVEVLIGTRESRRKLPSGVAARVARGALITSAATTAQPWLRTVAVGDRVGVHGKLEEIPHGEASYRTRSVARIVRPAPDAEGLTRAIGLVAEQRPRIVGRGIASPLFGILAGTLTFLVVFGFGGALATQRAALVGSGDGDRFGANSFAAATPWFRDGALRRLASSLVARDRVDGPRTRRAVEVELQRGSCSDAVATLIARADPAAGRQARALASRCELPEQEAEAAWVEGDFAHASASWSAAKNPSANSSEVTAHLLAGDMRAAARAIARLRRANDAQGSKADALTRERGLACLERYALARAGALSASESKAWDDDPVKTWECELLRRDLEPAATRRAMDARPRMSMSGTGTHGTYDRLAALESLLELETDPTGGNGVWNYYDVGELAVDGHLIATLRPVALERAVLDSPRAGELQPRVRNELARSLAAFHGFFGDHATARRYIDSVLVQLRHHGPDVKPGTPAARPARSTDAMADADAASLALLAGDRTRAAALVPELGGGTLRPFVHEDFTTSVPAPWWYPAPRTWALAKSGDATALERELRTQDASDGHAALFFFGDRFASQAPLREWLRWAAPMPCRTCGIGAMAPAASFRRRSATALGDQELAADAAAIETRFRGALLRRDVAVPIAILEVLNPQPR